MKGHQNWVLMLLIVLALSTSIYACSAISLKHMHNMGMSAGAETIAHLNHAASLTLAIVPVVFLALFLLILLPLVSKPFDLELLVVSLLYFKTNFVFPSQINPQCPCRNPRPPPVSERAYIYSLLTHSLYGNDTLHAALG